MVNIVNKDQVKNEDEFQKRTRLNRSRFGDDNWSLNKATAQTGGYKNNNNEDGRSIEEERFFEKIKKNKKVLLSGGVNRKGKRVERGGVTEKDKVIELSKMRRARSAETGGASDEGDDKAIYTIALPYAIMTDIIDLVPFVGPIVTLFLKPGLMILLVNKGGSQRVVLLKNSMILGDCVPGFNKLPWSTISVIYCMKQHEVNSVLKGVGHFMRKK